MSKESKKINDPGYVNIGTASKASFTISSEKPLEEEKSILHLTVKEIKTIIIDEIDKNNTLNELLEDFTNKYDDITIHVKNCEIILNQDFDAGNPIEIVEEILNSKAIYTNIIIKKSPIYYLFEMYKSIKSSDKELNDYQDECLVVGDELFWYKKSFFYRLVNNKKAFLRRFKNTRQFIGMEKYVSTNAYSAALNVVWFMIREGYFVKMHKKLKENIRRKRRNSRVYSCKLPKGFQEK